MCQLVLAVFVYFFLIMGAHFFFGEKSTNGSFVANETIAPIIADFISGRPSLADSLGGGATYVRADISCVARTMRTEVNSCGGAEIVLERHLIKFISKNCSGTWIGRALIPRPFK